MYAGPDPLTAVTAYMSDSSTRTVSPIASRMLTARSSSPGRAPSPIAIPDMPSPIWHGVFGITRTTRAWSPSCARMAGPRDRP